MPEPSPDTGLQQQEAVPAGAQTLVLESDTPAAPVEVERGATKKLGIVGWLAIIWVTAIVLAALLAPWLPIPKFDEKFIQQAGDGPSLGHPLGLDSIGQDMFARVIYGARASLLISTASVLFGLIGGAVLGLIAGYYRGKLDTVLS